MTDIDWNTAPEGATHYDLGCEVFCCESGWWHGSGRFRAVANPGWGTWRYIPRPAAWDGNGLPPVGAVCEYRWDAGDSWRVGTCVAHFEDRAVICDRDNEDCAERLDTHHVRPIRTPEQIAAEEREKAIDALCFDIVSHYEAPKMSEHYLGLAKALHAAGYRKVEGGAQ